MYVWSLQFLVGLSKIVSCKYIHSIMKISYYADYQQLSAKAKELILAALAEKPASLLCPATGNSPIGTYQLLASAYKAQKSLFEQLRILKLDEWGGVPMEDAQTCESALQQYIIKPLHITSDRYFTFQSNPDNPTVECARIQVIMQREGPIDVCVLGLGRNGHLAFNEPADALQPSCHVAQLSAESMQHTMAKNMRTPPTYGMTIGMADILNSRKIILLVTGNHKKPIIEKLLQKKISTQLPASLLWLHSNVECLIEESSLTN